MSGTRSVDDLRAHWAWAGEWYGRQVWPVIPPDQWSRDLKDRVAAMTTMAVNEAGYTPETWWDDDKCVWMVEPGMDEWVLDKARTLVYPALGIAFIVADQPPWAP